MVVQKPANKNFEILFINQSVFRDAPPTSPSAAQDNIEAPAEDSYFKFIKRLLVNKDYMLLLISYGISVAVFGAISTLLNQVVLVYYPVISHF